MGSDVIVLTETWYIRSDVLQCTPYTRQTFHFLFLIEALTGCRPGCLDELKWGDFKVFLLRDPKDPIRYIQERTSRLRGINNYKVVRTLRNGESPASQSYILPRTHVTRSLQFTVFFMGCPTICLLSILLARALEDNV